MIRPRRLVPGDRVALVAPASAFAPADLERGVAELGRLGFEAVYDEVVFARSRFEAGSPAARRVLHDAWRDPTSPPGGRARRLRQPAAAAARAGCHAPGRKLLVGYSDVTALLAWSFMHGW